MKTTLFNQIYLNCIACQVIRSVNVTLFNKRFRGVLLLSSSNVYILTNEKNVKPNCQYDLFENERYLNSPLNEVQPKIREQIITECRDARIYLNYLEMSTSATYAHL